MIFRKKKGHPALSVVAHQGVMGNPGNVTSVDGIIKNFIATALSIMASVHRVPPVEESMCLAITSFGNVVIVGVVL